MANRVSYLKFLAQNKNSFVSDLVNVKQPNQGGQSLAITAGVDKSMEQRSATLPEAKMNQLLMLSDDPKQYYRALEELKREQLEKGRIREDHLFEDKYIISERTIHTKGGRGGGYMGSMGPGGGGGAGGQGYLARVAESRYRDDGRYPVDDEQLLMHLEDNEFE